MATLLFAGGTVLFKSSGVPAFNSNCCCGEPPQTCCCDSVFGATPPVTITATIEDGGCEMSGITATATSPSCNGTVSFNFSFTTGSTACSPAGFQFDLKCPSTSSGASPSDLRVDYTPTLSGCDASDAQNNVAPEAGASCNPLNVRFCGFGLHADPSIPGANCECCDPFCVRFTTTA